MHPRPRLVAALLLVVAGCSHGPPPAPAAAKVERRDEWIRALRSDVERIGTEDGFEGQIRVLHDGKPEIERTFGEAGCLPLGTGRRVIASVTVALLVQDGKLGWEDRLDRLLPELFESPVGQLRLSDLLTDAAGLAFTQGDSVEQRLEAAERMPLQAAPGTRVDPEDDRPWLLVERIVAQVSGGPFERFARERVISPAGMTGTALGSSAACPVAAQGATTVDDQLRLVDALRKATVVTPATRDALWAPRLSLVSGSEMAYGFFVRTAGEQRAVGVGSTGGAPAYELWLDPAGSDALVLLGRTPARTARAMRTALGEFYALPPALPHPSAAPRRPRSK